MPDDAQRNAMTTTPSTTPPRWPPVVTLISVLLIVWGTYWLGLAVQLLWMRSWLVQRNAPEAELSYYAGEIGSPLFWVRVASCVGCIVAGVVLLRRLPWARTIALVALLGMLVSAFAHGGFYLLGTMLTYIAALFLLSEPHVIALFSSVPVEQDSTSENATFATLIAEVSRRIPTAISRVQLCIGVLLLAQALQLVLTFILHINSRNLFSTLADNQQFVVYTLPQLFLAVIAAVSGVGLLQRRSWARACAMLAVILMPIALDVPQLLTAPWMNVQEAFSGGLQVDPKIFSAASFVSSAISIIWRTLYVCAEATVLFLFLRESKTIVAGKASRKTTALQVSVK